VTIRQYIKRRFRDMLLVVVGAFALLQVLRACIAHWPQVFLVAPWIFVATAAPLIFWLAMLWFFTKWIRFPCPRCSAPLRGAVLAVVMGSEKINRCPHCRVSFDEPRDVSVDPR
jgi:hypothetical protein